MFILNMERSSEGALPPFTSRCGREMGHRWCVRRKEVLEGPKCTSKVPQGQNVVPKVRQEGRVESFQSYQPRRSHKVVRGSDGAVFYSTTPLNLSLYSLFIPFRGEVFS